MKTSNDIALAIVKDLREHGTRGVYNVAYNDTLGLAYAVAQQAAIVAGADLVTPPKPIVVARSGEIIANDDVEVVDVTSVIEEIRKGAITATDIMGLADRLDEQGWESVASEINEAWSEASDQSTSKTHIEREEV